MKLNRLIVAYRILQEQSNAFFHYFNSQKTFFNRRAILQPEFDPANYSFGCFWCAAGQPFVC